MNRQVVEEKLESLRRCVQRIELKTPSDAQGLIGDLDCQDIVVLNLERAVQICVDLAAHLLADRDVAAPQTMAETFTALADEGLLSKDLSVRLGRAVGFRNIAVHEYARLDWNVVYSIITAGLDDFRAFARMVDGLIPQP